MNYEIGLLMEKVKQPTLIEKHGLFYGAAPYAIMEYENDRISDIVTLATFKYEMLPRSTVFYNTTMNCFKTINETCCFVSWIDYELDGNIFSLGFNRDHKWTKSSRQGVVSFPSSITSTHTNFLECKIVFEPTSCDVMFSFKN